MKLSPLDIRKQEFRKVFRGYDAMEVDTFLEMVADEYESILKSKSEWTSKIKQLEEKLKEYQEIEKTLQKTLMEAQSSTSKSKEDSKKEAELIIKEAELNANKILEDSRTETARLKNEIMLLKTQKESLAIRLKHILNSQIELIKILEMDEDEVEKFKKGGKKDIEQLDKNLLKVDFAETSKQTDYSKVKLGKSEEKIKKTETSEKEDTFDANNLIEKMVLEIEEEDTKKEKSEEKDIKNKSIQKEKDKGDDV